MSNPVFPVLKMGQDSKYYKVSIEDPSMKTPMDGGYVVSRAKHTRKPRRTFTTGFTQLTNADRQILESFYDSVRGGSVIFDWTDPINNQTFQVRFASEFAFQYTGVGVSQLWDVSFTLQQA